MGLYERYICSGDALGQARATIGYLVRIQHVGMIGIARSLSKSIEQDFDCRGTFKNLCIQYTLSSRAHSAFRPSAYKKSQSSSVVRFRTIDKINN